MLLKLSTRAPIGTFGLVNPYEMEGRKAGMELLTFTVITTDPHEVVQPLHDRMPMIIPEKDYDRWLQLGDPERPPIDLLRPYDANKMKAWKVDKAVGNVKNDRPELIDEKAAERKSTAPVTQSLFG